MTNLTKDNENLTKDNENHEKKNIQHNVIVSQEQSFLYDTSEEILEEVSSGDEMKHSQFETSINERIEDFTEANTPSKASQVEKFEYFAEKEVCSDVTDISSSRKEKSEIDLALNQEEKISLSSSPERVENLFLTESTVSPTLSSSVESNVIEIPNSEKKNRRLSNTSIDENHKISSTPEGEKYFVKREQSFLSKFDKGEVGNLAG